jgi:outer membrane protein assembly factor BamB
MGLDTLWATASNLISGRVDKIDQSDKSIFLSIWRAQSYEIYCFRKDDGTLQWTYNEPIGDYFSDMHYDGITNRLILQRWNTIVALDAEDGAKILQTEVFESNNQSGGGTYGKLLDGYYYLPMETNNRTVGGAVRSKTTDLQNWEWAYRITQSEVDGIEPSTDSYNLWIHPETGDEILLLQHRMAFWEKRIDLVAYNMTADSMYWWHKDIEPQGNSNIRQIQIFKDRAYFQGSNTIHAVNMIDGTYQWKYEDTEKSFVCCHNIVFDEAANVVVDNYSNIDQSGIMAWDADNGTVKWNNTQENNYQAEDKIVFEGMLLQADGSLDKYIISNGRLEFALSDTERWLGFDQLIIDKKKQVLYTLFGSNGSAGRQLIAISVESIENF